MRFLLGPAGSGKTWCCLSEARAALQASPEGPPLLMLAPKQATFQLERRLLSDPELAGYTRLQILSFERLAWFLLDELAPAPPALLSAEGRVMVLRSLLQRRRDELKVFRASARLPGLARQLSEVFREVQHHQLGSGCFDQWAQRSDLPAALKDKLHDVALLLGAYREWLETHQLQDADRLLELAAEELKSPTALRAGRVHLAGLWLDGFAELTPLELDLLATLVPCCERATLAFCLDAQPKEEPSWLSVWSVVSEAVRNCHRRLAALPEAEIRVEVLARDSAHSRFAGNPVLARLEAHWSSSAPGGFRAADAGGCATALAPSLRLVACHNPEAEAAFAAREILRFVRSGHGRFRDCGVIVRALDPYHEPLRRVFTRYGIPFFLDRREPVAHHPLAELTRSALRAVALGWQHEDWFGALKTGLVPGREWDFDELENAALARGWQGAVWHQPIALPEEPALSERLERVRQQVVPAFRSLAEALATPPGRPDGPRLAEALRALWESLKVRQQLEEWSAPEIAPRAASVAPSVHLSVWDQMQAWLDNVALAFASEPLPLREWLPIVEAGLADLTVGVIPPALDQVVLSAIDRSRNPDLKLVFLLGLNEGVFPAPPPPPQVLTEADRAELTARGVCLGRTRQRLLGWERYYAYIALTRASERLVVTYAQQDASGDRRNPSILVAQLQRLFPGLAPESFGMSEPLPPQQWNEIESSAELIEALAAAHAWSMDRRRREALPSNVVSEANLGLSHPQQPCQTQTVQTNRTSSQGDAGAGGDARDPLDEVRTQFEALPEIAAALTKLRQFGSLPRPNDLRLSTAAVAALYGRELKTSLSALENFAACPFKFFAAHGMLAEERRRFEADPRQTGRFQHEVLSRFHRELEAEGRRWRDEAPEAARARIERIGNAVEADFGAGVFNATAQGKCLARWLVGQLQDFIEVVVGWARQNDFDPRAVELAFGLKEAPLPPWRIELGDGRALLVRGKIDRVDVCPGDTADEALVVVVDYKSRERSLDPVLLHHGLELQLLGYLDALRHLTAPQPLFGAARLVPVGAFYVPLRARAAGGGSRTEILERAVDDPPGAYQHTGRFDRQFLARLDTRGKPRGDQFKFAFNQDGSPSRRNKEALASPVFRAVLDHVEAQLRAHAEAIFAGAAAAHPYRKGSERACSYCEFQAVCRFDPWEDEFRVLTQPATGTAADPGD